MAGVNISTMFFEGIVALTIAILAYLAGQRVARYQRRGQMNDALQKSYADWFATEDLLYKRIMSICEKLVGFPKDRRKHNELTFEVGEIADELKELTLSVHQVYMKESKAQIRKQLRTILDSCRFLVDTLSFAANHYKENLEFHEYFAKTSALEVEKWPSDLRQKWHEAKDRFENHDAECPFKSEEFQQEIVSHLEKMHTVVLKLQENLARSISK